MGENTKIEWAHHTFNPWIGCQNVGPGCDHCYAEKERATTMLGVKWGPHEARHRTSAANWRKPLAWDREAARLGIRYRVFCASLADVFDNAVPVQWRQDLFDLILSTPHLDWLLVTKRIGNARKMLNEVAVCRGALLTANDEYRPPANVWLGITVVNQEEADRDIPKLLAVPAAVRFLSMEPLLGPVDLSEHLACMCGHCGGEHLDWMIVGGESGPHARPMHPDWARSLRDQCAAAGVPFMFKQWGEWGSGSRSDDVVADILLDFRGEAAGRVTDVVSMVRPREMTRFGKKVAGRLLDGIEHNGYPGRLP